MDIKLDVTGTCPLLVHNARLSNPLDPIAKSIKKISAKRSKTDDDYAEMAHAEFLGGLYHDSEQGPYMPGDNIYRALLDAARKRKLGPKVQTGVIVLSNVNPLVYKGPRDPEALWADESFRHQASVKVNNARVIRTRPIFHDWATSAIIYVDTQIIDLGDFEQIVDIAGSLIGLGNWRPRYGRFAGSVTVIPDNA
jgi:hypothetical protein